MHIIRRNSPTRVNNSKIVIDDRGAEVDQPSFVNRLKGEEPSDVDRLKEDNRNNIMASWLTIHLSLRASKQLAK